MNLRASILIPIYNDWKSASSLVDDLQNVLSKLNLNIKLYFVDDGSSSLNSISINDKSKSFFEEINIIRLRRNLGHQRAIAVGLTHINVENKSDIVIVMDGDGEDKPEDVFEMIKKYQDGNTDSIIFAERTKRTESLIFKIFYFLYKLLHLILVGKKYSVGNFSLIPYKFLNSLVVSPELWNHYAAAVFKLRLPRLLIPTNRGVRYDGKSQMSFVSLVVHGLSAISVYGEVVMTRLMFISATSIAVFIPILAFILVFSIFNISVLPQWLLYFTLGLGVLLIQVFLGASILTFIFLNSRSNLGFLPLKNYSLFIDEIKNVKQ